MKKFNYKHYIRKAHRYLGFFIGIQFLLWTAGGLYFSWTDLDEIHGDHLKVDSPNALDIPSNSVSPSTVIETLKKVHGDIAITKMNVVKVFDESFYAIELTSGPKRTTALASLTDGSIRDPISDTEARNIARSTLLNAGDIRDVAYLTSENVGKHHEYREKPLPAWVVTFDHDVNVYLSAETGQVGAIRTNKWRAFDFLWMLHTMDFQGRDNINNYVLRAFSLLGITTVFSGFALFFVSSRFVRGMFVRKKLTRGRHHEL